MPTMYIQKSIFIKKEAKEIFKFLNDFHFWPKWSPWFIADPDTSLNIDNNGKFYNWEGAITGSGDMKVLTETKNESISCSLNFYKPWKSSAEVNFELSKEKKGTKVLWTMKSSLPFFLFWMKKSMEIYVGMDYERGLKLLKDLVETGKTNCKLRFEGVKNFQNTSYIGFQTHCTMTNFEDKMTKDFQDFMPKMMGQYKELIHGDAFTLYHKFDPLKNKVIYTVGVPISEAPEKIEAPYFIKKLPDMKVYSVLHKGPYRHLANAWAAQMMHQRAKKFKSKKGLVPFEVYLNNPENTEEKELKTAVYFPVV